MLGDKLPVLLPRLTASMGYICLSVLVPDFLAAWRE